MILYNKYSYFYFIVLYFLNILIICNNFILKKLLDNGVYVIIKRICCRYLEIIIIKKYLFSFLKVNKKN